MSADLSDETVGWVRIDGQAFPLSEKDAWQIAWDLIGMCVDHKHRKREQLPVAYQGDPGDEAYLVMSGEIEIVLADNGKERVLSVVKRGDVVGEMALLSHAPRIASARVRVTAELIVVPEEMFQARLDKLAETDRVLRRILDVYTARLRTAAGVDPQG